jgi:hypothetical protein
MSSDTSPRACKNCRDQIGRTNIVDEENEKTTETSGQLKINGNDERAMNCEICKLIQKLGLRKSAHDLWLCIDKQVQRRRRRVTIVERTNRRLSKSFA